jgi:hypothetical protein
VELFANVARGLKSPYAFGDFNRLNFADISSLLSYEVGFKGGNQKANWRVSGWRTKQDSAAIFDGSNPFVGNQKTSRDGVDVEGRIALTDSINMNANFSKVFARIDGQPVNDHILSVPDWTAGFGFDGNFATGFGTGEWSVFDTIIGPQPLVADNSTETHTYHRVTARGAISPFALKGFKLAMSTTFYSDQYQEQQYDAGGGQFGISPQPTWKVLFSGQYEF